MDLLLVPGTYLLLLFLIPSPTATLPLRALLTLVTKFDCCSANCCNPVRNLDGLVVVPLKDLVGGEFVTMVCSHALFKSYDMRKSLRVWEREV